MTRDNLSKLRLFLLLFSTCESIFFFIRGPQRENVVFLFPRVFAGPIERKNVDLIFEASEDFKERDTISQFY